MLMKNMVSSSKIDLSNFMLLQKITSMKSHSRKTKDSSYVTLKIIHAKASKDQVL
jgi:hypothetical protein